MIDYHIRQKVEVDYSAKPYPVERVVEEEIFVPVQEMAVENTMKNTYKRSLNLPKRKTYMDFHFEDMGGGE